MADSGDPVDLAYRALGVLQKRAPVAVASWFEHALENFIARGADVGCALGLTKRARKKFVLHRRNVLIIEALSLCPGDGPTAKTEYLSQAIEDFRNKTWRTVRAMDEPPADLTDLQKYIFFIFHASVYERIPSTARGLAMIYEAHSKIAFVDHPQPPCSNQHRSKTSGEKHGTGRKRSRAQGAL